MPGTKRDRPASGKWRRVAGTVLLVVWGLFSVEWAYAEPADSQITIGYWNDNFIMNSIGGRSLGKRRDDFQTASFWMQAAGEQAGNWRFLDIHYSILTDRTMHFRTDLIAVRGSVEYPSPLGTVRAGLGLVFSGDFGGDHVQNSFHRTFGYRRVELPYLSGTKAGGIVLLGCHPVLLRWEDGALEGYVTNYARSSVIPCNARAGFELNTSKSMGRYLFRAQCITGYTVYYRRRGRLSSLFENGFTWGILASGGSPGRWGMSLWFTNNQYGLNQYQFGVSFSPGWNGSRFGSLNDTTFP